MRLRRIAYQATAIAVALLVGWYLVSNTLANLEARGIASGFAFLGREAGFEIGESAFLRNVPLLVQLLCLRPVYGFRTSHTFA